MGFVITGAVMLLAGIPFWFLPKSLPKQTKKQKKTADGAAEDQGTFLPHEGNKEVATAEKEPPINMAALVKGRGY